MWDLACGRRRRTVPGYGPGVHVRSLRSSDLDVLLLLNNENVPAVSRLDRGELARLARLSVVASVAELDAEVVGFALVLPPGVDYASENYRWFSEHAASLGYDDFAYLDRIAVSQVARRRGVGRALYEHVLERLAGATPVLFCEVNVRPRNETSLAFHAALGFREVGQLDTKGGAIGVSLLALDIAARAAP